MDASGWDFGPGNRDDYLVSPANAPAANQSNGLEDFLGGMGKGFGSLLAFGVTRAIDDPNQPIRVANTLPRVGTYYGNGTYQPGYSPLGGNSLLMLLGIGLVVFLVAKK